MKNYWNQGGEQKEKTESDRFEKEQSITLEMKNIIIEVSMSSLNSRLDTAENC